MDSNKPMQDDEEPILSLIQQIKDGTLNPKVLSKEIRQRCVELLSSEGYTEAQIAQIIMRSEKTVSRDLAEMRQRNAINPDIDIAKQIVGDMLCKAMAHHRHLMRLARSSEASIAEKAQSEFLAWRILREMVEKMQTLGYLPIKPQTMVSDVYYHGDNEVKSLEELDSELAIIEKVAQESGSLDEQARGRIKLIRQKLDQARIAQEISDLAKKNNNDQVNLKTEGQNE